MFENNNVQKRLMKRKSYVDALESAKNNGQNWKVRQLEGKIFMFNLKHYPNFLWNSSEKGTYIKEEVDA